MADQMMQHKADELATEQTIPAGYKQTEAGLIPEDWALVTIDDVASFSGGSQPAKNFFSSEPKDSYIRLIQIRDYKTSEYETYIPAYLARKLCSEHDIMIGRYGPPIFQILRGISGAYNVALIKTEPKRLIDREYLFYILKTDRLFLLMDMLSQRSSGQTGIELPALKAYPIPLPSKQEQIAISNVLSDIDALTAGLERLIAKKQSVKTATMQQLLTGRTRLPQFALRPDGSPKGYKTSELGQIPEDWFVVAMNQLIEKNSKITYGVIQPGKNDPAGVLFVRGGDIFDGVVNVEALRKISPSISMSYKKTILQGGELIISLVGYPGECAIVPKSLAGANIARQVALVRFSSTEVGLHHFICHFLRSPFGKKILLKETFGSAQQVINLKDVNRLELSIPSSHQEQTAIATILSDMDNELNALEQKLAKARDVKQGMMQQLLTGRIRLPLEVQA